MLLVGRGGELARDRLSGLLIPFEKDDGCVKPF